MQRELTIVFEPAEEGGFVAYIPEVPGAISEGATKEEARAMVLDALAELDEYRRSKALESVKEGRTIERISSAA